MSYVAYGRVQNRVESQRQIEYRLLGQVTGALIAASEKPHDKKALYDAVLWNQKVWDVFLNDIAGDDNKLPMDLRKRLVAICLAVRRETAAIIDGKGDLPGLIAVNRNIMEGLR